ncbi:glycine zipper 2TM domain-containing protein [Caenimonas sedimenti]|uniref:Glycine zipper 2TM domain-containing protein n=1 Tax=Caenimonas sedimenti TaxID=2596921 RepID=A0A562ZJG3_9BURK|nr:beta/gamma crystallin-related protein [Caenimonas sedimenti]TWO68720.1 glycine zipper 2TM domain-containing protein [Caenimonas sedimenti]
MKTTIRTLLALSSIAFAAQAAAQVTFYENENFQGRSYSTQAPVRNAERGGFNDRISSVIVVGQRWEACGDARFQGRCVVLRPGQYPSLSAMGMNDRISSARPLAASVQVADSAYAPMPVVAQDFRRRGNERMHEADVRSARAVLGTPAQRCWVEREQVVQQPSSNVNVPGAAIGAIVGGILGHQVGGGSGKKIATVGGAVGGAALGAQYGRTSDQQQVSSQEVRRCDSNPAQATPAYWDVVYEFRGQEHRVQMASDPGRTVRVNSRGEPRA